MEPIAAKADLYIDTSRTNLHQLRDLVRDRVESNTGHSMSILFESFGFKNGVPTDADFVFDTRCLPNPHWEPKLRPLTGRDTEVAQFLQQQEQVEKMYQNIKDFLATWIPSFAAENRSYMTIAIGCTGGQHRSVYLTERLADWFKTIHENVVVRHRELT